MNEAEHLANGSTSRLSRKRDHSAVLWMVEVSLVLCCFVPLLAIVTTPDVGRSGAWIATVIIMLWSGLKLASIFARGAPALFQFIFWMFVYIFLGLAPTIQIRSGVISSTTQNMPAEADLRVALTIMASLLAVEIGSHTRLRVRRRARRRFREPRRRSHHLSMEWTWVLYFVGVLCLAYYVQSVGVTSLFENREARQLARSASFSENSGASIASTLAWVPLLIAVGSLTMRRRTIAERSSLKRYSLPIALGAAGVLLVVNPISGARYTAGTVLFALVCFTGILSRKHLIRPVFMALLGAFLFLFPIADAFRRSEVDVSRQGFFAEYQGNGDYDSFWQIANSILYVGDQGATWGNQLLGVLLFWVPRSIWAGKPVGSGVLLADWRNYSFTNLSAPLWAEAYLNGGVVLLLVAFAVLGGVMVQIDERIPGAIRANSGLAIAACVFPAYFIIILRGSLLQATGILAVLLFSLWLVSRPSPSWTGSGGGRGASLPSRRTHHVQPTEEEPEEGGRNERPRYRRDAGAGEEREP